MPNTTDAPHAGHRSLVDRLFRNDETGRVVIVQAPNLPLWIYLVATAVRMALHPTGAVGKAVTLISTAALVWWSVVEIGWGSSLFRRLLGAVVLVGVAVSWAMRLA